VFVGLELPHDLVILIPLNVFHEIIVGNYLFKLIIIESALEFKEGRFIAKLLPMILNDFDNLGAILLTLFLRNEESLANQITRIDKWHQEVRMLPISSIVARSQ